MQILSSILLVIVVFAGSGCGDDIADASGESGRSMSGRWDVVYYASDTIMTGHLRVVEDRGSGLSGTQRVDLTLEDTLTGERKGRLFWIRSRHEMADQGMVGWDYEGELSLSGESFDGRVWLREHVNGQRIGGMIITGIKQPDSVANAGMGRR